MEATSTSAAVQPVASWNFEDAAGTQLTDNIVCAHRARAPGVLCGTTNAAPHSVLPRRNHAVVCRRISAAHPAVTLVHLESGDAQAGDDITAFA